MQDPGGPAGQRRRVLGGVHPFPSGLDADQADVLVVDKLVEESHGVGAAADARQQHVWELPLPPLRGALRPRLLADHALEVPDHHRVRVRARRGPQNVVRGLDVGDPVADGLGGRVLQSGRAGMDGADLGSEEAHAEHVEGLSLHVLDACCGLLYFVVVVGKIKKRGKGKGEERVSFFFFFFFFFSIDGAPDLERKKKKSILSLSLSLSLSTSTHPCR